MNNTHKNARTKPPGRAEIDRRVVVDGGRAVGEVAAGVLIRALHWFRAGGVTVEWVMADNGSDYVARLFRRALRMLAIRHIRTRRYTQKTNGKAERFIQTVLREWAYAIPLGSSDCHAADLPRWPA